MTPLRLLLQLLVPATLSAQQPRRPPHIADSTAATIVRTARAEGLRGAGWLVGILRQREGDQLAAKLNVVADGWTSDVIAASARSPDDLSAVIAMSQIVSAGSSADTTGVPFRGAMDRLIRIHRNGSGRVRSTTLWMILGVVGDRRQGLAYLRSVAESTTDATAVDAINALMDEALTGGISHNSPALRDEAGQLLKSMWEAKSVRDVSASEALGRFVALRSWK